ncbi:hypothetical protein PVAND_003109 [Polypedilum vanderplanki]|uniref:BCL2/adenovirus E1B 19 kDa protein-interacting protein 3 n=1 Tax=Polypedilum vanderplanki TaxID=319348 RepID=A0A9J6BT37_POLVA|nr:hypothetical protein PVAND_003109 [Polypedilum vanderplanki]
MSHSQSHTPPNLIRSCDSLGILAESWVELTNNLIQSCSDRLTPPLPFSSGEEYLRLLKEAQKESNNSSRISSRRDSPKNFSPKSPPNSPNPEPCVNDEELKGVFINYYAVKDQEKEKDKDDHDWMWQWSSGVDKFPPKDWKFEHPENGNSNVSSPIPPVLTKDARTMNYSMRLARVGGNSLFSKEVLYSLVITNVLSILIGAGIGVWLSKRGFIFTRLAVE